MSTQMWQRLRAARKGAGLRQIDMARKLEITRSGYAFHETSHDDSRTTPNVEQIHAIAEITKVPVHLLMDDSVSESDILRTAMAAHEGRTYTLPGRDQIKQLALAAVQFAVLSRDPSKAPHFGVQVAPYLSAEYITRHGVAVVAGPSALADIGRLLLLERAAGRAIGKHLLYLAQEPPAEAESLARAGGCTVHQARTPEQVADVLLSLK